jgi:hypothetical protein
MKSAYTWIAGFIGLVIIGAWWFTAEYMPNQSAGSAPDSYGYACDNGSSFSMTPAPDLAKVVLSPLGLKPIAADLPSTKRYARWNGTSKSLEWGTGNGSIVVADMPMWELFVQLKAYAKDNYIRGVREKGGEETYHCFISPLAMARLKLDATYMLNVRHAIERGDKNALFSGDSVKIDGIYFHEFRHVLNTRAATAGSKWGSGGLVDGCQILFCGAQALGMADLGAPEWVEKGFDFENQQAISTGKILGFKKPKFYSQYSGGTVEDFGVLSVYTAQ